MNIRKAGFGCRPQLFPELTSRDSLEGRKPCGCNMRRHCIGKKRHVRNVCKIQIRLPMISASCTLWCRSGMPLDDVSAFEKAETVSA